MVTDNKMYQLGRLKIRTIWIIGLGLLLGLFSSYPDIKKFVTDYPGAWYVVHMQSNDLLFDGNYAEKLHEYKMRYRPTGPIIAKLSPVKTLKGHKIFLQGIMFLLGLIAMYLSLNWMRKIFQDDLTTVAFFFAFWMSQLSQSFFSDYTGFLDAFGFFGLLVCLVSRNPIIIFIGACIAFWTDERAIISSFILFLFYSLHTDFKIDFSNIFNKKSIALMLAILVYLPLRFFVFTTLFKDPGLDLSTIGLPLLSYNMKVFHKSVTVFFGVWPLILFPVWYFYKRKLTPGLFIYSTLLAGNIFGAFLVSDLNRSLGYVFPFVLFSFACLAHWAANLEKEQIRKIAFMTFAASFLLVLVAKLF